MRLDDSFEDDLANALLDDVERELREDLLPAAIEHSHEILREYGSSHSYHVEPIIDSLQVPVIDRTARGVRARWGWDHPAAPFFELGTSDHVVQGRPVLSFVWSRDDAPTWVAEEFEPEGDGYRVFLPKTEPSGLPESRFVRDMIHWLRREIST